MVVRIRYWRLCLLSFVGKNTVMLQNMERMMTFMIENSPDKLYIEPNRHVKSWTLSFPFFCFGKVNHEPITDWTLYKHFFFKYKLYNVCIYDWTLDKTFLTKGGFPWKDEWLVNLKASRSTSVTAHCLGHPRCTRCSLFSLYLSCIVRLAAWAFMRHNVKLNVRICSTIIAENPDLSIWNLDQRYVQPFAIKESKVFMLGLVTYHLIQVYFRHWSWGNLHMKLSKSMSGHEEQYY